MLAPGATRAEVQGLLDRWIDATLRRDPHAYADLFQRDPDPVVAWPSGEVTRSWKRVFEHVQREFYHTKTVVRRVDVHDLDVVQLTDDAALAVYQYDVHAIDLWGASVTAHRLATVTLARTKDGLRFAAAHFAPAAAGP